MNLAKKQISMGIIGILIVSGLLSAVLLNPRDTPIPGFNATQTEWAHNGGTDKQHALRDALNALPASDDKLSAVCNNIQTKAIDAQNYTQMPDKDKQGVWEIRLRHTAYNAAWCRLKIYHNSSPLGEIGELLKDKDLFQTDYH